MDLDGGGLRARVLVLGGAPLAAPGADGGDVGEIALLVGAVGAGGELDKAVEGHVHPGAAGVVLLHEVGVDAAEDSLVGDDQDVLGPLELHDDRLQPGHHVPIRLPAPVPVVVLVLVARHEVLRIRVLDLLVRHPVARAGIQFIQRLPLELVVVGGEVARRLYRSFQG